MWRGLGAALLGTALLVLGGLRPASAVCVGDCDGDGVVRISELQRCVNLAADLDTEPCPNADQNLDGTVDPNEVDACVDSFLDASTCPMVFTPVPTDTPTATPVPTNTPTPAPTNTPTHTPVLTTTPTRTATPPPTNTPAATATPVPTNTPTVTVTPTITPTSAAAVCGNGTVEGDEECDDGNTFGGDGCAANCTMETRREFVFDPTQLCVGGDNDGQECQGPADCPDGACTAVASRAIVQQATLPPITLVLSGSQTITTGSARASEGTGEIPLVIKAEDVRFDPVKVTTFKLCACVRGIPPEGMEDQGFGPGVSAVGRIGCGPQGLDGVDVLAEQDHIIGEVGVCIFEFCRAGARKGETCSTDADCPSSPEGFSEADCEAAGGMLERGGGLCVGSQRCEGGASDGQVCDSDGDCPGGACLPSRRCRGGLNDGQPCRDAPDCPGTGASCEGPGVCQGGANPGLGCTGPGDCNDVHPGLCNGPLTLTTSGDGPAGSAFILNNSAIALIPDNGTCCTVGEPGCPPDAAGLKGPDGIPCTDDDPDFGIPNVLPTTTGVAEARVIDFNAVPGRVLENGAPFPTCLGSPGGCVARQEGHPFDCDALAADPTGGFSGGRIVTAFPALDAPQIQDNVTMSVFKAQ